MVELTPGEVAWLGALLGLPAAEEARRARLGTDTTKNHRRALAGLRKAHPDNDDLWAQEFTLKQRPTRVPDHGARAALLFLRRVWVEPIEKTTRPGDGQPADRFFYWASDACRQAGQFRSPGALLHHYRDLPSIPL
jgi:hypothetical protein